MLEDLATYDNSIWQKVKSWITKAIKNIKAVYKNLSPNSQAAKVLSETMTDMDKLERLFTEGVREAGERAATADVEVGVRRDGNIVYSVGAEETKNATELSEEDLRVLLENVQNGLFEDGTYLPLRRNTPEFYIEVVRDHSKGKMMVQNFPMAATVEHLRQNMEEVDGQSYGEERPHELSIDDIITISRKMGDPSYIVLQKNRRYAEVVSYYDSKKKKEVVVSIDIADSNTKPPKNYKHSQHMNGYDGGYYNIIVTQYELDDLQSYLNSNTVVYDKKKTNGKYQVGSGRIVTVTHDTPFVEDIVPQTADSVNSKSSISEENSSDKRYSIDDSAEVSGSEAADNQAALEKFGTTTDFEQAGFAMADGRMLKLSQYGQRGVQHRVIEGIYEDTKGDEAIARFIQNGNVRISAASPGIEISAEKPMTTNQLNVISRFASKSLAERERSIKTRSKKELNP